MTQTVWLTIFLGVSLFFFMGLFCPLFCWHFRIRLD